MRPSPSSAGSGNPGPVNIRRATRSGSRRRRGVAIVVTESGGAPEAWLRGGGALCAWTPNVLRGLFFQSAADALATITGTRTECSTALLTEPSTMPANPPRP